MRILPVLLLTAASTAVAQHAYDLVVCGGTAAGVVTAVAGARQGLKTVLLKPRNHVGGVVSGGLSGTDVGRREVIGGNTTWSCSGTLTVRGPAIKRHVRSRGHLKALAYVCQDRET